jgi:tetratricopeptide (TPR) repeat protein
MAIMIDQRIHEEASFQGRGDAREEARRWYERAAAIDPDHPRLSHLAMLDWEEWNFAESHATLLKAEKANPDDPVVKFMRGLFLTNVEARYEEAFKVLGEAQELDPQRLLYLRYRVQFEMQRGNYEAAWKQIEELTERFGSQSADATLMASCLRAFGRLDEAKAVAQTALAENPEDFMMLGVLGRIHVALGNGTDARRVLEEMEEMGATIIGTGLVSPGFSKAILQADLGDREAALDTLERAVEERDRSLINLPSGKRSRRCESARRVPTRSRRRRNPSVPPRSFPSTT